MIKLRLLCAEDRPEIERILQDTKHFMEKEIEIAMELVDTVLQRNGTDYHIIVAENEKQRVVGYGCWGEVPLTSGSYDIYWIAVSPDSQGRGVGKRILQYMENKIMKHQGRLILIETSSKEVYQGTRAFYEKRGYALESRIRDFYGSGDDRLIYTKRFKPL